MKALRLHAINDLRTEEVEKPVPKGEELLLKVEACGICGSDMPRVYELGAHKFPLTIGHEYAGTVVAAGEKADQSLIGRRAAIYPVIPCGKCPSCRTGNYAQCSNYSYLGSRTDGGFAEYSLIPSEWHLVLSHNDQVSSDALCMTEPSTVALHAVRRGGVSGGKDVVIFGAGPIGTIAARWCKLFGANVMLVDIDDEKKELAKARGFEAVNSLKEDCVEAVKEFTKGRMADICIEGTGTSAALNNAVNCLKPHGTITLLGNPHKDTTLTLANHSQILRKELTLVGIWNNYYNDLPFNEWKYTVEMIDRGLLQVEDLITHRADMDHIGELFEKIHNREVNICKAIMSLGRTNLIMATHHEKMNRTRSGSESEEE